MSTQSVNIVIFAKDNASIHFKTAEKSVKKFGGALSDVAKLAVSFFSIRYATQFTKDLVMAASDANEIKNKFKEVFKEQTVAALQYVDETNKALGRSRIDLMEWASNFQDVFVPLGFAREEARLMSQQLVTLSIDVASFKNKLEPEVMRDFQSAIVGNHEAVRKYGLIITETTLNQALINMGIKKGTNAASEQQKVLARLNIILSNTADAQGDAARTADQFTNQLRRAEGGVKDMSAAAGALLIPTMSNVLDMFNNNGVAIVKATARMIGWGAGIFAAIKFVPPLIKAFKSITTSIKAVIASQITLTSLLGPAGWANIAAGLAMASGFIIATEVTLSKFDDSLDNAISSMENTGSAAKGTALDIQKLTEAFDSAKSAMDALPANWNEALLNEHILNADEQYQGIMSVVSAYQSLDETVKKLAVGEEQYLITKAKQLGFDNYSIQAIEHTIRMRDKLQAQQNAETAYLEASLALKKQIATVGMNEQQQLIFDLKNLGLSNDKIAVIQALQSQLSQTTKEFNAGKMLVKNSLTAYENRFLSGVTLQRNYQQEQTRESKKQTPILQRIANEIEKMNSRSVSDTVMVSNFS